MELNVYSLEIKYDIYFFNIKVKDYYIRIVGKGKR